jgi:hypothetical protein
MSVSWCGCLHTSRVSAWPTTASPLTATHARVVPFSRSGHQPGARRSLAGSRQRRAGRRSPPGRRRLPV